MAYYCWVTKVILVYHSFSFRCWQPSLLPSLSVSFYACEGGNFWCNFLSLFLKCELYFISSLPIKIDLIVCIYFIFRSGHMYFSIRTTLLLHYCSLLCSLHYYYNSITSYKRKNYSSRPITLLYHYLSSPPSRPSLHPSLPSLSLSLNNYFPFNDPIALCIYRHEQRMFFVRWPHFTALYRSFAAL